MLLGGRLCLSLTLRRRLNEGGCLGAKKGREVVDLASCFLRPPFFFSFGCSSPFLSFFLPFYDFFGLCFGFPFPFVFVFVADFVFFLSFVVAFLPNTFYSLRFYAHQHYPPQRAQQSREEKVRDAWFLH